MSDHHTFTCAICKQTFDKAWSDEEAQVETQRYWPGVQDEECEVVCNGCWQRVHPTQHTVEYLSSLFDLFKDRASRGEQS